MSASGSSGGPGGGDGNDGDSRRYKENLPGLLKFCAENADAETVPRMPLSDERRQFLEDAFKSLQSSDPVRVMLEDIEVAMAPGDSEEDVQRKEAALEDLQLHCEDIDLANDFHKIGGYKLLLPLLESPLAGIRWRTGDLIATVAQNNLYSQQCLLEAEIVPSLIQLLDHDSHDMPKVKALYAISCIIREFPPGQDEFVNKHDGFSVLVRAMQSNIEKVQLKAAFLMAALCQHTPQYKDTLVNMGLLEQLIGLLHEPHATYHEHLMRALLVLSAEHQGAQTECRRADLRLQELLDDRISFLQGKDEYKEEQDFARELRKLCFHGQQNINSEVDR